MSLSKPLFSHLRLSPLSSLLLRRTLSFATPEEAAAERRRRKRRLRIEPPLAHSRPAQQRIPRPVSNPNLPKIPEPMSVLSGKRLELHNKILDLIRINDLEEASLLTRHSIYSNCRPTVYTCNAVLNALLRQARYSELLTLHRFITQASVAPSLITHNILLQAFCDCKKPESALEHFRILLKDDSPILPSPTTYRILMKGLVDSSKLDLALELKENMLEKGFVKPDPQVYNFLMGGFVSVGEFDKAIGLFEELREKIGEVLDGAPFGNLMKAYFLKGMESKAMEIYSEIVLKEESRVRFSVLGYNSVLDALGQNGKLDDAIKLFDEMCEKHNPPRKIVINLGSFNALIDAYCKVGKFNEAILVFRKMSERNISPDTLSYNNLISQLGENNLVSLAEQLFDEMSERDIKPDEYTYILLIESCFNANRVDDALNYFNKMIEAGLRPNINAFNKTMSGLVKFGRLKDAQNLFDEMPQREVKRDVNSYDILLKAYVDKSISDDAIRVSKMCLLDENVTFSDEMKEVLEGGLRKEERESEMAELFEEVKREKARVEEEKARAELAKREEEERKKAELAAKEEEMARATRAAIDAVLGKSKEDREDEERESEGVRE